MKKLTIVIVVIALLSISGLAYYLFGSYSDGYRAGMMIKFSKRGVAFKTYEGELNLGLVLNEKKPTVTTANLWKFSVRRGNEELINKLQEAVLAGKRVKVHYNEKFVQLPWRGDTKYMVDEVEIQ